MRRRGVIAATHSSNNLLVALRKQSLAGMIAEEQRTWWPEFAQFIKDWCEIDVFRVSQTEFLLSINVFACVKAGVFRTIADQLKQLYKGLLSTYHDTDTIAVESFALLRPCRRTWDIQVTAGLFPMLVVCLYYYIVVSSSSSMMHRSTFNLKFPRFRVGRPTRSASDSESPEAEPANLKPAESPGPGGPLTLRLLPS